MAVRNYTEDDFVDTDATPGSGLPEIPRVPSVQTRVAPQSPPANLSYRLEQPTQAPASYTQPHKTYSEDDFVAPQAKQYSEDDFVPEQRKMGLGEEVKREFKGGVYTFGSSAAEGLGRATGSERLREYGRELGAKREAETAPLDPVAVDYTDPRFLARSTASLVGSTAAPLVAGGAAALAGPALGLGLGGTALLTAGVGGAATLPASLGEVSQEFQEATGKELPLSQMYGYGGAHAAVGTLLDLATLRIGGLIPGGKSIMGKVASRIVDPWWKTVGKTAVAGGIAESVEEAGQKLISGAPVAQAKGESPLSSARLGEAGQEFLYALPGSILLGGVTGGVGAAKAKSDLKTLESAVKNPEARRRVAGIVAQELRANGREDLAQAWVATAEEHISQGKPLPKMNADSINEIAAGELKRRGDVLPVPESERKRAPHAPPSLGSEQHPAAQGLDMIGAEETGSTPASELEAITRQQAKAAEAMANPVDFLGTTPEDVTPTGKHQGRVWDEQRAALTSLGLDPAMVDEPGQSLTSIKKVVADTEAKRAAQAPQPASATPSISETRTPILGDQPQAQGVAAPTLDASPNNPQSMVSGEGQLTTRAPVPQVLKAAPAIKVFRGVPKGTEDRPGNTTFYTTDPSFAATFHQAYAGTGEANVTESNITPQRLWDFRDTNDIVAIMPEVIQRVGGAQAAQLQRQIELGDWGAIEHPVVRQAIKNADYDAFTESESGALNIGVLNDANIEAAFASAKASPKTDQRAADTIKQQMVAERPKFERRVEANATRREMIDRAMAEQREIGGQRATISQLMAMDEKQLRELLLSEPEVRASAKPSPDITLVRDAHTKQMGVSTTDAENIVEYTGKLKLEQRTAVAFGEALGLKVIFADGMVTDGLSLGNNTIVIDKDNSRPVMFIFGHEAFHSILRDIRRSGSQNLNAELDRFIKFVMSAYSAEDRAKWESKRVGEMAKAGLGTEDQAVINEEFWADVFGRVIHSKDFLPRLRAADANLYGKFVGAIKDAIDRILKAIGINVKVTDEGALATFFDKAETTPEEVRRAIDATVRLVSAYGRERGVSKAGTADEVRAMVKAYHGGPHKIEGRKGFALDKAGTGEGAAAYGWGAYFASLKDVAEEYRRSLAYGVVRDDGGELDKYNPNDLAAIQLNGTRGDRDVAIEQLLRYRDVYAVGYRQKTAYWDAAESLRKKTETKVKQKGYLYRAELDVNDEDLLDWDKPLSEQSEKVKKALAADLTFGRLQEPHEYNPKKSTEENLFDAVQLAPPTGGELYHNISRLERSKEAASRYLASIGIPGIRYLDQGSRAQGEGSHNYVIFRDDLIDLTHRNDEALASPRPATPTIPVYDETATPMVSMRPERRRDSWLIKFIDKHADVKNIVESIENFTQAQLDDPIDLYLQLTLAPGSSTSMRQRFYEYQLNPAFKFMLDNNISKEEMEKHLVMVAAGKANVTIARRNQKLGVLQDGGSGVWNAEIKEYFDGLAPDRQAALDEAADKWHTIQENMRKFLVKTGLKSQKEINMWLAANGKEYVPFHREDMEDPAVGGRMSGAGGPNVFSQRRMGSELPVVDVIGHIVANYETAIEAAAKNRIHLATYGMFATYSAPQVAMSVNPDLANKGVTQKRITDALTSGLGMSASDAKNVWDAAGNDREAFFDEVTAMGYSEEQAFDTWDAAVQDYIATNPTMQKHIQELVSLGLDPDEAVYVFAPPKSRAINPQTGQVEFRANPQTLQRDNVLVSRINGEKRYVIFNKSNPQATRMVRNIKNMDDAPLGLITGAINRITRFVSAMATQYDVFFGPFNALRDVGTMSLNLTNTPLAGKQAEILKNIPRYLVEYYKTLRAERAGRPLTGAFAELVAQHEGAGGTTGHRDIYGTRGERIADVYKKLEYMSNTKIKHKLRNAIGVLGDLVSDYNDAWENSTRLAVFKAGLDAGLSEARAAALSKEITINFNRKGTATTQMNALFAFANASLQGTAQMLRTLTGPAGRRIVLGGMLLGVLQSLILAAAEYDDDDLSPWIKDRSFIFPNFFGDKKKYAAVPYPLGFNVLPSMGRNIMDAVVYGPEKYLEKFLPDTFNSMADALSPIGPVSKSPQTVAPTILDPWIAVAENLDYAGRPISREDYNTSKQTPGYTRARNTATGASIMIAKGLNMITGGGWQNARAGKFSPTPDDIDYLVTQAAGGVGRSAVKVGKLIEGGKTGEAPPTYNIPIVGRLYGNLSESYNESNRFYNNMREMQQLKLEVDDLRANRQPQAAYYKRNPEARLIGASKDAYNDVQKLTEQKNEATKRGASKSYIKAIEERISRRKLMFNELVKKAKKE